MGGCDEVEQLFFDQYAAADKERQNALAQLDQLKRYLQASNTLSENAAKLIDSVGEPLSRQERCLEGIFEYVPLEARRTPGAERVIGKVFSTPELLENVLGFLCLNDALCAQMVSKAFFHAIESSPRLQRNIGLLGDKDADLYIPVPLITSVYFFVDDLTDRFQLVDDNCVTLTCDIFNGVKRLPKLGSRSRRLLICQPPLKRLAVYADCCFERYGWGVDQQQPTQCITSETGITLGDVIDAAHRIAREHRTCPSAPLHMHDNDGFVNCSLYMSAKITLREGDPRLEKKRKRQEQEKASRNRTESITMRMPPYIAAKQAARASGQRIPTLAEFESSTQNSQGT